MGSNTQWLQLCNQTHRLLEKNCHADFLSRLPISESKLSKQTKNITMVALNDLPPEAAFTADFCERMDVIFYIINSRKKSVKTTSRTL